MSPIIFAFFFATPAAAIATLAGVAAIPVAVHLLNRRRYRIVDWAAMRFLQSAVKRNNRRLRLEQWLLLAVRSLLILLPALAMAASMGWAEPTWQRLFPGSATTQQRLGRTHHVLVLDASLSMSARRDDGSGFERAQAMATKLVRSSPGGDGFSVIMLGAPPHAIVPGPAEDPDRVTREIDGLHCTHGTADVAQGLQMAEELLKRGSKNYAHHAVYVFTDMQRSQWATPATPTGTWIENWQRLHHGSDVAFVNVGAGPATNLAVTSLEVADRLLTTGIRTALTATIQNHSPQAKRQARVELWQGKTSAAARGDPRDESYPPRLVQQELTDLAAGGSATVSFPIEFRSAGDYVLEVRLEPDALIADDHRALPVTVRESLPLLLVNGRPARDRLDTATGWLAAALDPFPAGSRSVHYPARPRVIDESRLSDVNLIEFDCVYLCDIARPGPRDVERLEAYVRSGGTAVLTLGPNVDPEVYNRLVYRDGEGLLPAKLIARQRAPKDEFIGITADEEAFRRAPLVAFSADDDRAGLLAARFKEYWRIDAAAKTPGRRLLNFLPPAPTGDALIYEWSRGRGRVVLFTSTANTEWTGWPVAPSFLPFMQELMRATVRQPQRRDFIVGEPIDELLPSGTVATEAKISPPERSAVTVPLIAGDDSLRLHFNDTDQAGLYRATIAGLPPRVFAVNLPNGEGDLAPLGVNELPATGAGDEPQVITDPERIRIRANATPLSDPAVASGSAGAIGSSVARWLLLSALAVLLIEPILAWQFGSARDPNSAIMPNSATPFSRVVGAVGVLSAALLAAIAIVVVYAATVGTGWDSLPNWARTSLEKYLGIAPTIAAQGTRMRIDHLSVFSHDASTDRWLLALAACAALALAGWLYVREFAKSPRWSAYPLTVLRFSLVLALLTILLPQLRLIFEREGWRDIVVLVDDSQSMGVADDYPDSTAARLAVELTNTSTPSRLQLAHALLTRPDRGLLAQLVANRHVHLHVFRMSDQLARIAEVNDDSDLDPAIAAVHNLQATGKASRLGNAVRDVLQEFRGATLAGIVALTDGITTDGEDLAQAGQHASRAGVPLILVGLGDSREPKDLVLSDLQVDDLVHVGDRLIFEAKLTVQGMPTGPIAVTLHEQRDDRLIELARTEVVTNSNGVPAKVRIAHVPTEAGERTYVLQVPPQPGEVDTSNNRLERTVLVSEFKRTRVLLIDGRPRYDFRAVKTVLERESEAIRGNKSVELKVLLLDADADYARQDRSALDSFPSSRDELFTRFDVVILGDVDPQHPQLGEKRLQWLADFVRERGGGVLFECGSRFPPSVWRETPLATIVPVEPLANSATGSVREQGYVPKLTPIGVTHPVLRFAPNEAENLEAWSKLKPFFWAAVGFKPKPAAEVLAELPAADNSGATSPLMLQQFVGAGRVMLFGFDETWRWRQRAGESQFNQFWLQTIRYLAQTRPSRPEVRLDRQTPYHRGEPIRVTVRFPDDKPPPASDSAIKVSLQRTTPDGVTDRQTVQLATVAGSRATYETVVTRTPEGSYRFSLVQADSAGGSLPHADARVIAPPGEMDRLQMNRGDMERAAQLSRGRFYTLADSGRLIDDLPAMPRATLHQPRPPLALWNTPLVFLLTIGLISTEWILRKRHGLL